MIRLLLNNPFTGVLIPSPETPPHSACNSPASSGTSDLSDVSFISLPSSPGVSTVNPTLSVQDEYVIQLMLALQEKYEKPSDDDIHTLTGKSQVNGDGN